MIGVTGDGMALSCGTGSREAQFLGVDLRGRKCHRVGRHTGALMRGGGWRCSVDASADCGGIRETRMVDNLSISSRLFDSDGGV